MSEFMGVTWREAKRGRYHLSVPWCEGVYGFGPIQGVDELVEAYDREAYAANDIEYTRRPWPRFEPEAAPKKNGRRKR